MKLEERTFGTPCSIYKEVLHNVIGVTSDLPSSKKIQDNYDAQIIWLKKKE